MNSTNESTDGCCSLVTGTVGWVIGALGTFGIIGALAYYSVSHESTVAVDAQRGVARLQQRKDLEAATGGELGKFAIDATKENKAQLSVARAMEVFVSEWKDDSAAGRAKLLERLEASKKVQSFE
jgi:hypothetical protein